MTVKERQAVFDKERKCLPTPENLQAMLAQTKREQEKDPDTVPRLLIKAGVLTKSGRVAKRYR